MKKIAAFVLCTMLLLSLALPAGAENYLYHRCVIHKNTMEFLGNPLPQGAKVSVSVNGNPLARTELSSMGAENRPITYVCVVDCSRGFGELQRKQQLDVLETVNANLRPVDEFYLFRMGEELSYGEKLTTEEDRAAAIHTDFAKAYSTPLYDSILHTLEKVNDSVNFPNPVCIIVMSDGIDNLRGSNPKLDDLQQLLAGFDVSLNTIALMDRFPDGYAKSLANRMGSLADQSHSGKSYILNVDSITAEEAAADIMNRMLDSAVIRISTDDVDRSEENAEITISYTADNAAGSGTILVPVSALPEVTVVDTEPVTEPAAEPAFRQDTEPTEAATQWTPAPTTKAPSKAPSQAREINDTALLVGIGVIVAAAIAAGVVLLLRSRTGNDSFDGEIPDDLQFMDEVPLDVLAEQPLEPDLDQLNLDLDELPMHPEHPTSPVVDGDDSDILVAGLHLTLLRTEDNAEALSFYLPVNRPVTIGRSQRADHVLNAMDSSLSGCHFEMLWDGTSLLLRDIHSTNGTALNGKLLQPEQWTPVHDTLFVGSYEYRIAGEKEKLL